LPDRPLPAAMAGMFMTDQLFKGVWLKAKEPMTGRWTDDFRKN
jgi:hypothetical protein